MYKLLLVDDEYMILEGLKYLLPWQALGFEIVQTCRSAKEALVYLEAHPIDLLITDITMPEMSGIEMVSQAQSQGNFFATIILSGYQEFTYVKQGMQLGVKNYLVKPVDKEELLTTVNKVKLELDNQVTLALQQQAYVENHLIRWLNDDLNEREFQEMLTSYGVLDQGPYTVIQLVAS
ncbi:MAG: response regulator, partial [Enterococcus sp.]|nr:response regulator [Enterococcus sp.]